MRESLGAALLRDGRAAEAEKVFREDLDEESAQRPLALRPRRSASKAQHKTADAAWARAQFDAAWKDADSKLRLEDY